MPRTRRQDCAGSFSPCRNAPCYPPDQIQSSVWRSGFHRRMGSGMDYARGGKQRTMTLTATEFLRRFFLHVLPKGFVRIRYFGFLANRFRTHRLPLCWQLLASDPPPPPSSSDASFTWHCPHCGAAMLESSDSPWVNSRGAPTSILPDTASSNGPPTCYRHANAVVYPFPAKSLSSSFPEHCPSDSTEQIGNFTSEFFGHAAPHRGLK